MNKKIRIIYMLAILLLLTMFVCTYPVYASTSREKQELVNILNQYKNDLGDLNQLKTVIDKIYSDVNSANTVDDNLKQTLKDDINMLDNVSGINSLLLTVLKSELNSQMDELNDSNLGELKEEVKTIKDWVDEQVGASDNGDDNPTDNTGNTTTPSGSNNTSGGTTGSNTSNGKDNTQNKGNNSTKGNTTTTTIGTKPNKTFTLPNTGAGRFALLAFIVLVIITISSLIKYNKMKEIK